MVASLAASGTFDTWITLVTQKFYLQSLESRLLMLDQLAGELGHLLHILRWFRPGVLSDLRFRVEMDDSYCLAC